MGLLLHNLTNRELIEHNLENSHYARSGINCLSASLSPYLQGDKIGTNKESALPVISLIVAVLNKVDTIQRCISSIAGQTYNKKELIIIDGGSTDGTVDLIERNSNSISYWESNPDRGIYHAWNKALDHATGEWICFLGADDRLWEDSVLDNMAQYLIDAAGNTRIVYGRVYVVRTNGTIIDAFGEPWQQARKQFLRGICLPHQGVLHHRSLFEVHGHFDESFEIAGDYEMLLRELRNMPAKFVSDVTVAAMQYGGLSSSPVHKIRSLREIARARKKNGPLGVSLLWSWIYIKACLRLTLTRMFREDKVDYIVNLYRKFTGRPII